MCGSSPPEDKSDAVAQIEAGRAREAEEIRRRDEAEKRARFDSSLSSTYSSALDEAKNYFASQGLDPEEYLAAITQGAQSARSKVPDLAGEIGSYFDNLGSQVYTREQDAQRARSMRDIDSFAREGFAERRIADTADDPFLQSILDGRYNDGEGYVRNLLDRGVVTSGGFDAAVKDLTRQKSRAMSQLQTLGLAELEKGRSGLRNTANTARTSVNQLRLGDSFNPFDFSNQIDQQQSDFFANLAGNLEGSAPTDLFDTRGLAAIAGAAQGANNTTFDPNAFLGFGTDGDTEEDDDEEDQNAPIF